MNTVVICSLHSREPTGCHATKVGVGCEDRNRRIGASVLLYSVAPGVRMGGQGSCVEDAEQPSPAPPRHRRRTGGRVLPFGGLLESGQ